MSGSPFELHGTGGMWAPIRSSGAQKKPLRE
jgi:hypothetical protein